MRRAASPGAAVTLLRSAFETDARSVLPAIAVPVLVLHRAGDPFTGPEHGRYLAEHVPGAKYVELSGVDHPFFAEDVDQLLGEIQEFLTGVPEAAESDRVLATVMFADVIGSTEHATRLGDRQWRAVLDRYYAVGVGRGIPPARSRDPDRRTLQRPTVLRVPVRERSEVAGRTVAAHPTTRPPHQEALRSVPSG